MSESVLPRTRRAVVVALTLLAASATALPLSHVQPAAAAAATTSVRQDFNGDGYADLAVGAPDATVAGRAKAGYVAVLYGSANGLRTATKQVFSQNSAGVPGGAEAGDRFGAALASADLDGDGHQDLIVGVPGEDTVSGGSNSGYTQVIRGGAKRLAGAYSLATGRFAGDGLGERGRLMTADIDGDGAADVVTVERQKNLRVVKGPFDGTANGGEQLVTDRYDTRILDLAAGDLDGDGITDIAATANSGDEYDSRRVPYWMGTPNGLTPFTLVYDIDGAGLQGGESLDIGDVNRDGFDDIVVGRAVDGYDSDLDTYRAKGGRVTWIPGTAQGPDGVAATFFNQDAPDVPGTAEKGDGFGTDVQVADVNGDGYPDVATGVPGEDLGRAADAGAVVVLRGGAGGLTGAGARAVTQNTADVPGAAEKGDAFGRAVHLGDADGDGRADLAAGAPGENTGAGFVWYFRSTAGGVVSPNTTTAFGASVLGTTSANGRLGSGFAY
ncbi:FG-GAP-like repeat-containing protein [Streptomyces cadmiisoli]|uniref:FG-GAP-like repeat-containing protein n=1 Tax=Streptomyces cadmiisoli TaxID=2184053 RepID=UPI001FEB6DDB|nr:FG-GAP-like repeat-containing protein [Streptomyces cadmiisoli]